MRLPQLRLDWGERPKQPPTKPAPAAPGVLAAGCVRRADLVAPEGVEVLPSAVRVGPDRWVRTYMVHALPGEVEEMFLAGVLDGFGDLDLTVEVHPVDRTAAEVELTGVISRLGGEISTGTAARSGLGRDRLEKARADYEALRALLGRDEDSLYRVAIAIQIGAPTEATLLENCRRLETDLGSAGIRLHQLYWRQVDGLGAAGPLPNRAAVADYQRLMARAAVAASLPLTGGRWVDPEGMLLGRDLLNGSPVLWSLWSPVLNLANVVVVGRPGSGKSMLLKAMATRAVASGTRVAVIDQVGEYVEAFGTSFGADVVPVDPDRQSGVNPYEIAAEEDDEGVLRVPLRRRIEEGTAWTGSLLAGPEGVGVTEERLALVEQAVAAAYAGAGITEDPESLWLASGEAGGRYAGRRPRARPQVSDVYAQIEQLGADRGTLATLRRYTRQGARPMFDCPSREIGGRLVVVDVRRVSEDPHLQAVAMSAVLGWLWSLLMAAKGPKAILVDEAWQLTRQKQAATFLSRIARGARKRHIALITATQFVREFLESPQAQDILAAAPTRFIGHLTEEDVTAVRSLLELSPGQSRMIAGFGAGQFLLRSGQRATLLQVTPTPEELRWFNTDPRQAMAAVAGEG